MNKKYGISWLSNDSDIVRVFVTVESKDFQKELKKVLESNVKDIRITQPEEFDH